MSHVLFLAHRAPFAPDRGDRIRSWHVIRYLAARARVHLVAFDDDVGGAEGRAGPITPGLAAMLASHTIVPRHPGRVRPLLRALAERRPFSLAAFDDPRIARAVEQVHAAHPIAATYVFSGQMAQYARSGRRTVVDFVDRDSAKFAAYADDARAPLAWLYRREARLLGAFELQAAARADASLFVSTAEAALLPAPRVHAVENGIDAQAYDPAAVAPAVAGPGPLLVFTGQMDYRPNVDAVVWFAAQVLPLVQAVHPVARFAIVGRAPTDAVRALARTPGVIVTGEVPDVRGWLAAADVVVAPLQLARGIQNKVLEAMAMARPVVASAAAAEGIDHAHTLRVADAPADVAAAVLALLADRGGANALGVAARAQVIRRYDWEARLAPLDQLLGLAAPRWRSAA